MRNLDKLLVAEEDPGFRRQFKAENSASDMSTQSRIRLSEPTDGLERPLSIKEVVLLGTPAWVARPGWLTPLRSLITRSRAGRSLICSPDHNSAHRAAKA